MTGKSQLSFAAIKAALLSARLIMVSTASRSTPASASSTICSLYISINSSRSIFPMGLSCSPVIVRSPATYTGWSALDAASLEMATSSFIMDGMESSSPYSASFTLLAVKVGAYRISVPAAAYSVWSFSITSRCSRIHRSGQTPEGIPARNRLEPVAPSRYKYDFAILPNASFVMNEYPCLSVIPVL